MIEWSNKEVAIKKARRFINGHLEPLTWNYADPKIGMVYTMINTETDQITYTMTPQGVTQ